MLKKLNKDRVRGVTLIELMIVIVIVAILASIAVPTYRNYALRAHRAEAKAALLNVAAAQEKYYLQNNSYALNSALTSAPPSGLGMSSPTETGRYTISIDDAKTDANNFAVVAQAANDQTADKTCNTFTLHSNGTRSATDANGADTSNDCWLKK